MDRTVIDTWKAEEKEISDRLHKKLAALTLLHPPTDEFRKCFVDDMFIKPNQKGFFHVMHYLFTILDPAEFKKRFYWPIVDKRSESNFRSSTVQYLNYLNEKHNLQWANIKSYLVVMPGGMKFITFLSDFVDFVVAELIKQREKYLGIDSDSSRSSIAADMNLRKIRARNKCLKTNSALYIKETDVQVANLNEKCANLRSRFEEISKLTKVPVTDLLDKGFLDNFAQSNREYFEANFVEKANSIASLEQQLTTLKVNIESYQTQELDITSYNKDSVKKALSTIENNHPNLTLSKPTAGSEVRFENLVTIFNEIFPVIARNFQLVETKSPESRKFEENVLYKLKTELGQTEGEITKFLAVLSQEAAALSATETAKTPLRDPMRLESHLNMKFIFTPPIKLDITDNKIARNPRLPFLEDCIDNRMDSFSLMSQTIQPRSAKKNDSFRQAPGGQGPYNKSKIMDPMKLLRSLSKPNTRANNSSRNLSALASKWKERESLLGGDDLETTIPAWTEAPGKKQNLLDPASPMLDTSNPLYQKKSHALQKVQNASMNLQNLSTSPSGRLDSLVTIDHRDFPKILLNDSTLLETSLDRSGIMGTLQSKDNDVRISSPVRSKINNENDLNMSNLCSQFAALNNLTTDADTLFNISDSVLKDIPM